MQPSIKMCDQKTLIQTNPRYPTFTQAIFTAGDDDQFETSRVRTSLIPKNIDTPINVFNALSVFNWDQIGWEKYQRLDSKSVENTFRYLFDKFKKGLFVKIGNNSLTTFLPFSNANYRNEFASRIVVDKTKFKNVQDFLNHANALAGYGPAKFLPIDEWVANNAMFRYDYRKNEGDNNVVILKDMFATLCVDRAVPDVEFFVNRRDYPLLRLDDTEPYNHLYGSRNLPLLSHNYAEYSPILSCSIASGFADLAMPTYEDWARAKYQESKITFPNECRPYPKIISKPWQDKLPVAIFRGASTGAGTTPLTNQRLKALEIANGPENDGLLDVGITAWNLRPRKFESDKFLTTIERPSYPKANKLTLQEQSSYKYILTLEGHVAAYRLSYELSSGSTVLLAGSRWQMWYYRYLKPFVHYVPVKEDLSDLLDMVKFCRDNDAQCEQIAKNALNFYDEYLGTRGILDYLQKLLIDITFETGFYEYLPDPSLTIEKAEREYLDAIVFPTTNFAFPMPPGPRCIGKLDATLTALRTKTKADTQLIRSVFKSKNGSVNLYKTNDFYIVGKTAANAQKQREHNHEAYLGLTVINELVGKCPNFAYSYGKLKDSDDIYIEYVSGITMADWLSSPQYNFKEYLQILMQINLALKVAQNHCGFVHYDLYPWNVMIQPIKTKVTFDYNVGTRAPFRYDTAIIPILIDFGKSRAIVYEKDRGLIDHGLVNRFKSSPILDTLTILFSSMKILDKRLMPNEFAALAKFPAFLGISNFHRLSHYGALFEIAGTLAANPSTFIDFLASEFGDVNLQQTNNFELKMERGNAITELEIMKHNDPKRALLETVVRINRQTRPTSADAFTRLLMDNLIKRRRKILDQQVAESGDALIKKKYATVSRLLEPNGYIQPSIKTTEISVNFPQVEYVQLDKEMSRKFLQHYSTRVTFVAEDWKTIWTLCCEGALFDQRLDIFNIFDFDAFEYLSAIASNNTLLAIWRDI
jgi:Glycosyl transferase family 90